MERWDLLAIDTPDGTRDPVVLATEDAARAVLIRLAPGQVMRDHEVKERAWVTVVEGTVQFDAGGDSFEAGVGSLVTFAPSERHAVGSADGARILLVLAPWPGEGHYRGDDRAR